MYEADCKCCRWHRARKCMKPTVNVVGGIEHGK